MNALKICSDKTAAYHEAGHAVFGYLFGMTVGEVTTMPNVQFRAHTDWTKQKSKRLDYVRMLLAGLAAEAIERHDTLFAVHLVRSGRYDAGGTSDSSRAWGALHDGYTGTPDDFTAMLDELLGQVIKLLECAPIWSAIDSLAKALLDRKTLSSAEVLAILDKSAAANARRAFEAKYAH